MTSFPCIACSHPLTMDATRRGYGHCPPCGVWMRVPQPSEADLAEIYGAGYYASWGAGGGHDGNPVYWDLKRSLFRTLLNRAGVSLTGKAALDVGCATGACLSVLAECGARPHGIDVNPHAVATARRLVPDAHIRAGWLEDSEWAANSFDLVMMSDVIEHARNPWTFMTQVVELLRPGGRVVVLTPDVGSLSARAMGNAWSHIKDEHLFLFNRGGLSRLLTARGCRVVRMTAAPKPLSLDYAARQFEAYPLPGITPVLRGLRRVVPHTLAHRPLSLYMGEMLAVAEKL